MEVVVVITKKNTGRSKGYGFVIFKDQDSAMSLSKSLPFNRWKESNCNLAAFGAQKYHQFTPQHGMEKISTTSGTVVLVSIPFRETLFISSSTFPYPSYRYPGYPQQQGIYIMNYYNAYCGQYFPFLTQNANYCQSYLQFGHRFQAPNPTDTLI
ncbi:putative RNA-binding family protein [Quillaja saponaria]|uniref:RNA-binding family protein n=1 Tax=Quillaja saponaria TaxID=32244 RepID=A0AAD7PRH3_QUISA|nr:putative RNA-binding family protein [Quillaja saponaria]